MNKNHCEVRKVKCVLHIGTEKTGTTLLQDWLYSNKNALRDQGVFISEILGKTNNILFPVFFQKELGDWARRKQFDTLEKKNDFFKDFPAKFKEEVEGLADSCDLFIITSEHLHSRLITPEEIESVKVFLEEYFSDIYVICYFRPQAEMAVSLYSTALKNAETDTLDVFLDRTLKPENYYYNFKEIAGNWSRAFGKERCIFKIYDRDLFADRDIRKDFISSLPSKLSEKLLSYKVENRNESLSQLTAAIFRKINHHIPYWNENNKGFSQLNVKIKRTILKTEGLDLGRVDSPQAKIRQKMFSKRNQALFKEYFRNGTRFLTTTQRKERVQKLSLNEVSEILESVLDVILPHVHPDDVPRLFDNDADFLRDTAISIEKGKALAFSDALKLMQLAKRARPNGYYISQKVEEYTEELSRDA